MTTVTTQQHEAPEAEAAAKLATHMTMAVQLAETVIRIRQRELEQRAAGDQQAAAAARAERTARHAADRVTWSRTDDRRWTGEASNPDLARTWCAAAVWADTDPAADRAARRCESELERRFPEPMEHYNRMRDDGAERLDAMSVVAPTMTFHPATGTSAGPADAARPDTATDTATDTDTADAAPPSAPTTSSSTGSRSTTSTQRRDARGRRVDETGRPRAHDLAGEATARATTGASAASKRPGRRGRHTTPAGATLVGTVLDAPSATPPTRQVAQTPRTPGASTASTARGSNA